MCHGLVVLLGEVKVVYKIKLIYLTRILSNLYSMCQKVPKISVLVVVLNIEFMGFHHRCRNESRVGAILPLMFGVS